MIYLQPNLKPVSSMENPSKEASVNIGIGIVVVLAVVIMIVMEVAKVNKDNNTSRKGTVTNTK
jgi:hypothetical protein